MKWSGLLALLALSSACGPTFSQAKLASYPPRSDNCELDFIDATRADISPGGKWRVVGYLTMRGADKSNPMSPENRALVHPRICQLGGVAAAVMPEGMPDMPASSGRTLTYAALRLADEPSQHAQAY